MGRNLILEGIVLLLLAQLASLASGGRASRSASAHGSLSVDSNATTNSNFIRSTQPALQFMKSMGDFPKGAEDEELRKTYTPLNQLGFKMKGMSLLDAAKTLYSCMTGTMKNIKDGQTLYLAPVIQAYTSFAEGDGKKLVNQTALKVGRGIMNAYGSVYGSGGCHIAFTAAAYKALLTDKGTESKTIKLGDKEIVLQSLKTSLKLARYIDSGTGAGCEVAEFGVTEVVSKYQEKLKADMAMSAPSRKSGSYDSATGTFRDMSGEDWNRIVHIGDPSPLDIAKDLAFLNVYNYLWTSDKVGETDVFLFPDGKEGFSEYLKGGRCPTQRQCESVTAAGFQAILAGGCPGKK